MRNRLLAVVLTAALTPLVSVGLGATAASAAPQTCPYPPGGSYSLDDASQGDGRMRVVLYKEQTDGRHLNCGHRVVHFFVHGPREFSYAKNDDGSYVYRPAKDRDGVTRLHRVRLAAYHETGTSETNSYGVAALARTGPVRWYAAYTSDNGTGNATTGHSGNVDDPQPNNPVLS